MPRQTLKKRPDGRYVCKYKGIFFYGKTQTEALSAREEYKKREKYGSKPREQFTFAEYAAEWLPTYKQNVSVNVYNTYVRNINKISSLLPAVPLRDIRPSDIQRMYNKFGAYGQAHRDKIVMTTKAICKSAVADSIIDRTPCTDNVQMPKGKSGTHRALEPWEIKLIEETYQEERMGRYAMLMLYAGLRRGEAAVIDIDEDIDFDAGVIHVTKAVHIVNGIPEITTPKTASGIRDVPLFAPLRKALEGCHGKLVSNNSKYNMVVGKPEQIAWETYTKHLSAKAGRQVKIREHDLRHTFATMLYEADVDIKTASRWMGHANEKMIISIYAHLTEKKEESARQKIENLLSERAK